MGLGLKFKVYEELKLSTDLSLKNQQFYQLDLGLKYHYFKLQFPIKTAFFMKNRNFPTFFSIGSFFVSIAAVGFLAFKKRVNEAQKNDLPNCKESLNKEIKKWNFEKNTQLKNDVNFFF